MSCSSWSLKESNAESTKDNGVLDERTRTVNWVRRHSCDIFSDKLAEMYPCHENLYEAKLKSNGLITLVEEISRQHNGESVEGLLLVTFMQIYNGKKATSWAERN